MSQRWRKFFPLSLRYITRVKAYFDPLDAGATGTKEFFFQATNRKLARTNSKCVIAHQLMHDCSPPYVELEFKNGAIVKLLTADRAVDQISQEVALANRLQENSGMGEEEELNEEEDEEALKH